MEKIQLKLTIMLFMAGILELAAIPATAAGNSGKGPEFDCGWVNSLTVTNKALLGHIKKVTAKNFDCFTTGNTKAMSVDGTEVVFDFAKSEATVILENGKKILTFPMTGQEPAAAPAKDRWIALMGGGGESKTRAQSVYHAMLSTFDTYLRGNPWKQMIIFGGWNEQTDLILRNGFPDASKGPFTWNNYNAAIATFEAQLNRNEIKADSQVLIVIATQGAKQIEKELTHRIAVNDFEGELDRTTLKDAKTHSIDRLKELAERAKAGKFKLAIVDLSEHSGSSLALANERVCVISATGPDHFSSVAFAENFAQKMKAGRSLEAVFLETRKNTADNSFAMISTPEGIVLNRDLYAGLTPYLYHYESNPAKDKLVSYLNEAAGDAGLAARESHYSELKKRLDVLADGSDRNIPDLVPLRSLLAEYKTRQDRYIEFARSLGMGELSRRETFEGSAEVGSSLSTKKMTMLWKEVLETNADQIITNVAFAKLSVKDTATQAKFQASINMYLQIKHKRDEILMLHPSLKDYAQKLAPRHKDLEESYAFARKIAAEEKKLYDGMYSTLHQKQTRSNACRDFVL